MTEATQDTASTETATAETAPENTNAPENEPEAKTFTQEDVNTLIEKRLASSKAKLFKDEVEPLKAQLAELDAAKSQATAVQTERDEIKTQLEAKSAEAMRLSVALNKGLPAELIPRLQGSSQEELEADADALLKLVKPATGGANFGGGTRPSAPSTNAYGDTLRNLIKR